MSNAELSVLIKSHPLKTACVIVALFSGVGIYLVNGRIDAASLLLQQKTTEGSRLEQNVRNSAQLAEHLETLTSAAEKIQTRFVSASQLATNLQYFYRLETESGVELTDLRQTTGSGPSKSGKAPSGGVGFAVSVKGDYEAILGWLRRLEKGPHYCRVLSAAVSGSAPERAGPLTISLSLELFAQP